MLKNTILAGAIVLATGSAAFAENGYPKPIVLDPASVNYSQSQGSSWAQGGGKGWGKVDGSGVAIGAGGGLTTATGGGETTTPGAAGVAGCANHCDGNTGPALIPVDPGTGSNAQSTSIAGGGGLAAAGDNSSAKAGGWGHSSGGATGSSIYISGQAEHDVFLPPVGGPPNNND
jgi:hypothetical protein